MKLLLTFLTCCLSSLLFAQNTKDASQQFRYSYSGLQQGQSHSWPTAKGDTAAKDLLKQLLLVGRKPDIYRLPQDNMPCIVPDPNATVAMPNGWRKAPPQSLDKKQQIPNPVKPFKFSPSRPLLLQPQKSEIGK